MVMLLITSLFQWWYGDGIRERLRIISGRLESLIDYFSFGLLIKTLFSPYRQISAGSVQGSLEVKFRAMIDKLFSRVIGAFIRLIILTVGAVVLGFMVTYSVLGLVVWGLVPFFPVIGVGLMVIGWTG
tara:strand:- start:842 stop:1225 length:384 start_codon:yes stop_codon:yes gene_type:complete